MTSQRQRMDARNVLTPIYDFETPNKSFITVHKQLKALGYKNNAFFLLLIQPALQGVDPHDPNIDKDTANMIITECFLNPFYYLREVVRIPEQGGTTTPFILDRGTLAGLFCFVNNIDYYLMKPRQTGKTVGIEAILSWAFKFGTTNSDMMFVGNSEDIAKKNLSGTRDMLQHLPAYIAKIGTESKDAMGKTIRKTDNVKKYKEPGQNNSMTVAKRASTSAAAEKIGRGFSQCYQFFDEAEFTDYIDIIVKVSGMAYHTASRNSAKNGGGHCRIFATTPGDLSDKKACASAMTIVDDCVVWNERFYDEGPDELKRLLNEKSEFRIVYIEYDYKQLGLGEEWFVSACSKVGGDIVKIRREILLERFSGNRRSPFAELDLQEIVENQLKPIRTEVIRKDLYEIDFYEEMKRQRTYFISIDPSDGTGSDNYAMTVMDPYTLNVVAEFKSQYMTIDGMFDLVCWFINKYTEKPLIIIEKNRNGLALIDKFRSSRLKHRIYHSPEVNIDKMMTQDEYDHNGFIKEEMVRRKYYGVTTNTNSRELMMTILVDAVRFGKNIIRTKNVVKDLTTLVIKNDKIQADQGEHDDCVMSWLLGLYVYYYGKDLHRFGFEKGQIPEDVETDSEFIKLQKLYNNPEIKKQFPTMYSYYQSTIRPQMEDDEEERLRELKSDVGGSLKIGGLTDLREEFDSNPFEDTDSTSIMDKWLSMNTRRQPNNNQRVHRRYF